MASAALAIGLIGVAGAPAFAHPSLDEAAEYVDRHLAEEPGNVELQLHRAALHVKRSEWDAAAVAYTRAVELGADRHAVDIALSEVFLGAGLPRTAEFYADRAVAANPTAGAAFLARGRARSALGMRGAAAEDLARGVELRSRPEPSLVLEVMNAQTDDGAALAVADTAMKKIGVVASLQLPAIELERERRNSDRALVRVDALLTQSPEHPGWLVLRGELLEEAGRPDEARRTYERALRAISMRPPDRRGERVAAIESRLRARLDAEDDSAKEGDNR